VPTISYRRAELARADAVSQLHYLAAEKHMTNRLTFFVGAHLAAFAFVFMLAR
jgi:hypothetical protein